jgi:GR25 family glycosyltransferase involved in LPS biosynthesis
MNIIFEQHAFIIHLSRMKERKQYVIQNIKNAGFMDITLFEGVDGQNRESVQEELDKIGNPLLDTLRPGAIGCLLSHLKLYQHIINHKIEVSTIFEDDVHFHPEWKTLCHEFYKLTPKDFDIIYIGNQLDSSFVKDPMSDLITTEPVYCSHAYIVTLEGAQRLYDCILNKDMQHEKGLLAIDVMIRKMQEEYQTKELKPFRWYSWNGTRYPCIHNQIVIHNKVISHYTVRNTGLVFQNTDFISQIDDSLIRPTLLNIHTNQYSRSRFKMNFIGNGKR